MRVIVAGSRSIEDYLLVKRELDRLLGKLDKKKLTVLSGHAVGVDRLGERWCDENMVKYELWHPDWNVHGKSAGHVRNAEMVNNASSLVAFWDMSSRGTAGVIEMARKKGLKVRVVLC